MLRFWRDRKQMSLWARLRLNTRDRLLSGMLVIVPLGITVYVLRFLYGFTAGRLTTMVQDVFGPLPFYAVPAVSVAILLFFLYLVGLVANVVVGRKLIALAEAVIRRIPLVKSVYGASKQVVEAFSFQNRDAEARTVALVAFPHTGMLTVALLTGKTRLGDGRVYYTAFIPTTPNVSVGLFELIAPEDVYRCSMPVEEAVKMVVSGGILGPQRLRLTRASQTREPDRNPGNDVAREDQCPEDETLES